MVNNKTKSVGPNYQSYVKAYNEKKIILAKKGLSMRDKMFTKSEFKFAYKLERQHMVKLVKEGKRKVVGNITQNLVSEQSYDKSLSQARTLKSAYKKLGYNISITSIREGSKTALEAAKALKDEYYRLKDIEGIDIQFAEMYFGS